MRVSSYRPGLIAVAGSVLAALVVCWFTVGERPAAGRAAQDLSRAPLELGSFAWVERSGGRVTDADLRDRVWVASFIFTRCKVSCPRIAAVLKGLQDRLAGTGARLVSISVDPAHDTPEVLSRYAKSFGADPERWLFLTGDADRLRNWVVEAFKVPARAATDAEILQGAEDVAHSSKLALVDRGNQVVGYFDADDPKEVDALVQRVKKLDGGWGALLPTINAGLNGASALVLVTGWGLIRARRARAHAVAMLVALGLSAVFLACYLIYHFVVVGGSVPFQGEGRGLRLVYFTILLSHTVLAAVLVPLIVMTVMLAVKKRFDGHRRIAQITFPIWLYVSLTGVVVYWMLYRMPLTEIPTVTA